MNGRKKKIKILKDVVSGQPQDKLPMHELWGRLDRYGAGYYKIKVNNGITIAYYFGFYKHPFQSDHLKRIVFWYDHMMRYYTLSGIIGYGKCFFGLDVKGKDKIIENNEFMNWYFDMKFDEIKIPETKTRPAMDGLYDIYPYSNGYTNV